jgi:hypothetical protein
MNKDNFDITFLKPGDEVSFAVPYLDTYLKFKGEVISLKMTTLEVSYKTSVGEQDPYKINKLITEIPYSFLT